MARSRLARRVRTHDSSSPSSPLRPGQAGNDFKPVISGAPDLLITKQVNSAFYGEPSLQDWLDQRAISAVTICGITANHCCEMTARMAGNLGYRVWFSPDATRAFDREAMDGSVLSAAEIRRVTGANLHGEFATVCSTDESLSAQRTMPTRGTRRVTTS